MADVANMQLVHPGAEKAVFNFIFAGDDAQHLLVDGLRLEGRALYEETLAVGHIKVYKGCQLCFCFNAFGYNAGIGQSREFLHAFDESLAGEVFIHPPDEAHVQFDEVGLHVGNQVEPGISRPGVVYADLIVLGLVMLDNLLKGLQVSHGFTFCDFKNNIFHVYGEAG